MIVRTIRNLGGLVLGVGLALGAIGASAQTDTSLPDAQIESNVLKALATAPDLSTQNIQTSTVYGTVTLSGNVQDDALRTEAENLAARADGVKKVVDELTIGETPAAQADEQAAQDQNAQPDQSQTNQPVLQSDGTYAPAPNGTGTQPPPDQAQQMQNGQQQGNEAGGPPNGVPPPPPNGYPQGNADQGQPSGRQPLDQNYAQNAAPIPGGQQAGLQVTIPAGAMLRIRINRGIDSNHIRPGTPFDGTVLTDVPAGGAVAIPRGATVTGTVIHAKKAGAFKGEGELSLQITSLTLGGTIYPLTSEIWAQNGSDKSGSTVGHTVGLGAFGALLGGIAGGGAGAAIGAGVGAGAGLAGSASSPRGQIIIPPESVITFRIAAPLPVRTVSEQEMQRLSYAAGPPPPPGPPRRRYYNPYGYYGPQ